MVKSKTGDRSAFGPVGRTPIYQQVAVRIREAILTGELESGSSLPPERELCETFDVSRGSIREALRVLEAQGLVSLGSGGPWPAVVTSDYGNPLCEILKQLILLDRVCVNDLMELRLAVEVAAATRAAQTPRRKWLNEARKAILEMSQKRTDLGVVASADLRFHIALVKASGNEALLVVMLGMRSLMEASLKNVLQGVPDLDECVNVMIEEHTEILDTLESGQCANQLIRTHVIEFYARFAGGFSSCTASAKVALGLVR